MEWHLKKWNLKTQRYPTSATYRNLEGGVGSFGGSAVVKITVHEISGVLCRNCVDLVHEPTEAPALLL